MQRSALVVVLLLLALVGAGAVWLLQGSDPMAVPGAQTGEPAAGARPVAATPVQAEGPRGELAAASAGGDAAARERAALPAEPVANGERYFVRGRLVDRAGAPRAGVDLQVADWAAADVEFDVVPAEMMGMRSPDDAKKLPSWRTGADGRFEIPLPRGRDGTLRLVEQELVFAGNAPYLRSKKGDQDLGDLRVLRACALAGVVQDASGATVADVKVGGGLGGLWFGGDRQVATDAQGRFRLTGLQPGKWTLRTASSRFLPAMLDVELAEEQTRDDLVLVVKPGQAIAGQVVDERGVGVAGMKVGSQRKEARGAMAIERFTPDEATTTDANGYFTLSGLGDEAVTVRTHGPGHGRARATDVPVGTGNLVLRVQRCGAIEGVLRSADGKPIADSTVRVAVPGIDVGFVREELEEFDPLGDTGNIRGARTLADGSFRLENVRPGSVTIAANGAGHRRVVQRDVAVEPGQTTKGVLLLAERGAVATVTVVDPDGKPVAGATVEVQKPQQRRLAGGGMGATRIAVADVAEDGNVIVDGGEPLGTGTTDDKGVATIAGLPAVQAEVVAQHPNFAASSPAPLSLPATGGVEVGVALRQAAFAEIAVVDTAGAPIAGMQVELSGPQEVLDAVTKTERTDGEGRVRFGPLPAGAYTAKLLRQPAAQRFGDSMMTFGGNGGEIPGSAQALQLVGGETTKLTLQRPVATTLRGVVLGADGPVADCEIELTSREAVAFEVPGGAVGSATTAADGTFAIENVLAGDYTLRYGKATQRVKCTQEVSVPPNVTEFRQDLALHTGKLRAQVVLAGSGEPIAGAEVEVVAAKKEGGEARREQRVMMVSMSLDDDGGGATTMTLGGQAARTGADGVVEIDDVPVGEWSLQVTHKKFAPVTSKPLTVVERQTTDAGRIELAAAGIVRGSVLGSDGKKVGMALVMHRAIGSQEWSMPQPAMGGNFRLESMSVGKHELRAQELTQDGAERFSPIVEVQVVAGETATAELRLPAR
jgi:uncharacterized GH25 family protein